jgi:hypothetical protein
MPHRAPNAALVAGLVGSALALTGPVPAAAVASPVHGQHRTDVGAQKFRVDVRLGAKVRPRPVFARRTDTRIKVRVFAPGGRRVRGHVQVDHRGFYETARLRKSAAVVKLGRWPSAGQKRVRVRFVGNGWASPETKVVKFRVRKR